MKSEVAVLDADKKQRAKLCRLLQLHELKAEPFSTFKDLDDYIPGSDCRTAIINLDNIKVDNNKIRKLKTKGNLRHIIALSEQSFHPELEEAFRDHISVCISVPVEPDEIMYWLSTFDP